MSAQAEIRADFIKRLFAVAVSVGFAATFVDMDWVKSGSLPNRPEWEQMAILFTGLVATVLSWDGYLLSISNKPLTDYPRFWIDIFLVFIYMFFLISSKQPGFWLPILAVVFGLYVLWDFLTVRVHPGAYNASLLPAGAGDTYRARGSDVFRVYKEGFLGKPDTNRGPIITLSWAVYFVVLMIINLRSAEWQVFVAGGFAVLGLALYRGDKIFKPSGATVAGFAMWQRALIIVALLSLAGLYFCAFRVGPGS